MDTYIFRMTLNFLGILLKETLKDMDNFIKKEN
jgi:hypothetical protein